MSGGFPGVQGWANNQTAGAVTATGKLTSITPSSSNNTKGSYAQLIAATTADIDNLLVLIAVGETLSGGSLAYTSAIDIAVGASGSELVVASNLVTPSGNFNNGGSNMRCSGVYSLPIRVPAGSRISARAQTSTGSTTSIGEVGVYGWDSGLQSSIGASIVDAVGFQSGSTLGTTITASGSANTKGSYAQLTAATAYDYMGFLLTFDAQNNNNQPYHSLSDLAIGASGSEKIILSNLFTLPYVTQIACPSVYGPFWTPIPAGSRIAARFQAETSGSVQIGMTVYGIR